MSRSLWMVATLTLAGSAMAAVNPMEMVDVSRGGLQYAEVRSDTAPTVADLAAQLRAEGHGPVDEAHLARSLARGESFLAPCADGSHDCRTLAYAPPMQTKRALNPNSLQALPGVPRSNRTPTAPSAPPTLAAAPSGPTGNSSFADFVPLLVGILQLFLGLSTGGATGYAANPGYPGYQGFTNGRTSPGPGGVYSPAPPRAADPYGLSGPAHGAHSNDGYGTMSPDRIRQATPSEGESFFQNLPLPQGSWNVGPNGHFWDCRRSDCSRPHHGNDLHAPHGTPVYAVAAGTVKRIKHNPDGYDWYIIIEHDATTTIEFADGRPVAMNYNTLYAHIGVTSGLQEGQRVEAGQQIAIVDREGVSSPHCHFEVLLDDGSWKGVPLNPDAFADFHPDNASGVNGQFAGRGPQLGRGLV